MRVTSMTMYTEEEIAGWIQKIKEKGIGAMERDRQKQLKAIDGLPDRIIVRKSFTQELARDIATHFHDAAYCGDLKKLQRLFSYLAIKKQNIFC